MHLLSFLVMFSDIGLDLPVLSLHLLNKGGVRCC
jgi:hypothetical protein